MKTKSAILLKVLLNRYEKGSPEIALKWLPEEMIKNVSQIPVAANNPLPLFEEPKKALFRMHYSWLLPYIQKLPKGILLPVISSLSDMQSSRLKKILKLDSENALPLAPMAKNYIAYAIAHAIKGVTEVLPMEYLPETPFNALGLWSKNELVELIEFLGIHDLSNEMKRIVDKKILKNAYNCLSAKEQQYLKICMHLKEKVATPGLGLEKWKGEAGKLKSVLQARGLIRLGKALSGSHPDLIWHLMHILDTGRGTALSKYCSTKALPGITAALSQQAANLMNFLKT